jgi:hypothetical protein
LLASGSLILRGRVLFKTHNSEELLLCSKYSSFPGHDFLGVLIGKVIVQDLILIDSSPYPAFILTYPIIAV